MSASLPRIELWRIGLDGAGASDALAWGAHVLSHAEKERMDSFMRDADRSAFGVTRIALRSILASRAGMLPSQVSFKYLHAGKPILDPATDLHFNCSHSGHLAVVAVARGIGVGVDVERLGARHGDPPDDVSWGVVDRFFTAMERARIEASPPGERQRTFLSLWSRKESLVKLDGRGIAALEGPSLEERYPHARFKPLDLGDGYVGWVAAGEEFHLVDCGWWSWAARRCA